MLSACGDLLAKGQYGNCQWRPMRLFRAASVKSCRKSAEKSDHLSSNNNILIQKRQKIVFNTLGTSDNNTQGGNGAGKSA